MAKTKTETGWHLAGGTGPNVIFNGAGFFVSYLTSEGMAKLEAEDPLLSLVGTLKSAFDGGNGKTMDGDEETDIVKDGQYFILNGDWRPEYTDLIPKGFKACKEFFDSHLEFKSSWSN